jgi:hypothetical protein
MMRICGTKRQTGKLRVNKPLRSAGTENNTNKGHEQIQETKRIKQTKEQREEMLEEGTPGKIKINANNKKCNFHGYVHRNNILVYMSN